MTLACRVPNLKTGHGCPPCRALRTRIVFATSRKMAGTGQVDRSRIPRATGPIGPSLAARCSVGLGTVQGSVGSQRGLEGLCVGWRSPQERHGPSTRRIRKAKPDPYETRNLRGESGRRKSFLGKALQSLPREFSSQDVRPAAKSPAVSETSELCAGHNDSHGKRCRTAAAGSML